MEEKVVAHSWKIWYKYILLKQPDGFPSGQRGQTVNLLQIASVVRIHLHPLYAAYFLIRSIYAGVAELADAQDLKSCGTNLPYRFDSGRRHCYLKDSTFCEYGLGLF